ncbi:hypothetical protein BRARA_C01131 [Brassica rapa]|uniref:Rab3GAP catalytic subunit conserved domain-containing protein n=1 Tax=Brassica campestris TaxID=3711 RepID=A0A398A1I7_BRACM|nr:hypothetical protein BRARA_C01131 [Brassica rapa]
MASTSRSNHLEEDDDAEEEVQHFADFTLASSWERFISDIEANCRQWLADGPKNLVEKGAVAMEDSKNLFKVKNDLRSVTQSYCMEFYFQVDDNGSQQAGFGDSNSGLHDLQLCFGVKDFLLIAPQSASGVLLDAPESSKLLSAVAIALSNCASLWPVFVPVHDPSRKAYIGIQNMGTVFTRRFEADLIGSQVPMKLMHLEGLYELFFVREVRWCWEESQPLPKMPIDGSIDLSTCLIHQKLHLLAICIEKKCEMNEEFLDCIGSEEDSSEASDPIEEHHKVDDRRNASSEDLLRKRDSSITEDSSDRLRYEMDTESTNSVNQGPTHAIRRGSAGPVGTMMLLKLHERLHAPFTQDPPLMTEDMHEERLQAVEAFGDSLNVPGQLEKDILLSDMSAFKAANPDAVFEDFIRWHSPGDWESSQPETAEESSGSITEDSEDKWPPQGRLSQRMSDQGNLWRKSWSDAPALPADEQKPLLDPNREGEKILHYLETVRPHQLLEQMVCTAFRGSADTLNQTNFGDMRQMTSKLEQLYLIIRSTLGVLQRNNVPDREQTVKDLRRLCVVFEHVEKLVTVAASLHRKFLEAPRLAQVIFSDFYSTYDPVMGINSNDEENKSRTEMEVGSQEVSMRERQVVSSLFSPPSANQSWRKVLSMGNLLNGHEPVLREIIFSTGDDVNNGIHYAAAADVAASGDRRGEEIETHRMYVSGTSNDLRVALSVTSCD